MNKDDQSLDFGDDLQLLHLAILRLSDPMNVIISALFFGMESSHPNLWEQWAHHRASKQCWITWASSWGFRFLTTENVRGWKGWLYGCVWKWGMHPKLGLKPLDLRSAYSHSNPCLKKKASRGLPQSSQIVKFGTESAECAVPLLRCVWSQPKPSTRSKPTCDFLVVVLTNHWLFGTSPVLSFKSHWCGAKSQKSQWFWQCPFAKLIANISGLPARQTCVAASECNKAAEHYVVRAKSQSFFWETFGHQGAWFRMCF